MNRRKLLASSSCALGIVATGGLLPQAVMAGGDLRTLDGETTGLTESLVSGKWNLVMIWSTDCGICRNETPALSVLHEEEAAKDGNITLLGVSIDGIDAKDAVLKFAKDYEMRFPTLLGEFITVASEYVMLSEEQLRGTPTFMLFDPAGALAAVNPGPVRPEAVRTFVEKKTTAG